jgi:16S rRNA (guanine527-N7)-methyltransferase
VNNLLEILRKEAERFGVILNDEAVGHFFLYLEELKKWNKKINLFRRKNDQEIIVKDFLDSLTISKYLFSGAYILDVGSGGGFPGIPIKISRHDLRVVLSEIRIKKIYFLKNMIRVLGIKNLEVMAYGNERLGEFDFIISRAFGSIAKLIETGVPYLKENGQFISMKGKRGEKELDQERPNLKKMGWIPYFMDHIELPVLGHERVLIGLKRDVSRETNFGTNSKKISIS